MAYIFVNSFKRGLDTRRGRISAQQGSLVVAENVHVTRGGEIEKRKAFSPRFALPPGKTFGLHATRLGIYVFGSDPANTVAVPSGIRYQRLQAPGGVNMTGVVSADTYNSLPYVVATFDDGSVHHFYNGERVTDWDIIAPEITDLESLGQKFADLISTDPDVSASYALVAGVPTITITANAPGTSIPITATVLNAGEVGNNSATVTITTPASAGVAQVVTVALSGTYTPATDAADLWSIIIAGRAYNLTGAAAGVASTARTFRGKVYATVQGLLYFSDAQNPTRWTSTFVPDPGQPNNKVDTFAGFESVASQTSNADSLVTVAPYQNHLAIFARRATQIWAVVPGDPKDNVPVQILDNVGTMAPRSAINFGELDVFFLGDSGIRSLRARDASNAAVVFDVGTSIDPLVRSHMDSLPAATIERAVGIIEPREGRYLLAVGDKVFVFSFYPAADISAWTVYLPGFTISDFAVQGDRLYCRAGDNIYLYGGETGQEYDSSPVTVELAFLDAEKPAHRKRFTGLDAAGEGGWTVAFSNDPGTDQMTPAGHFYSQTFSLPRFALSGMGTHASIRFSTNDPAPARLSSAAIHFDFIDPPR